MAGLTNDQLRRRLREEVHQKRDITFLDVRSEAIRWTKDEEDAPRKAVAAQAEVSSKQLEAMQAMIEKLSSMDSRMKQLEEQFQSHQSKSQSLERGVASRKLPYTRDGRPICLNCNEAGHIKRKCPKIQGNGRPQ